VKRAEVEGEDVKGTSVKEGNQLNSREKGIDRKPESYLRGVSKINTTHDGVTDFPRDSEE